MVDKIEVTVKDLFKKHDGKSGYDNMYSFALYSHYVLVVILLPTAIFSPFILFRVLIK